MQLESVTPSHRALAVLGYAREHLVEMSPDIVAHRYHRLSTNVNPVHHPKAYIFMKSISLTKTLATHLTKHR